jgi:DNA-binding IclR family transcriptional regulator/shikimate kinase
VGRALAQRLGWPLSDSDEEMTRKWGASARDLRSAIGVEALHELEARHLLEALESTNPTVICAAASTVEVESCRHALADPRAFTVWLNPSPMVLSERFATGAHRPTYGYNPLEFLSQQRRAREPLFKECASMTIEPGKSTTSEVVGQILGARDLGGYTEQMDENEPDATKELREPSSPAPAVTRAAALLKLLAQPGNGPLGLAELSRQLHLPKSSIANLCNALEAALLVRRTMGGYQLGPQLLELGTAYLRSIDELQDFHETCRGLRSASQETLLLGMLDFADVLYLARHDGTQPIRLASDVGRRMPASCTALGKAMLAQLDPVVVKERYQQVTAFSVLTPRSKQNLGELLEELELTRARGYAIDDEENTPGVMCVSVALDMNEARQPGRAVSVTLMKARATDELLERLIFDLRQLATHLSLRVSVGRGEPHP